MWRLRGTVHSFSIKQSFQSFQSFQLSSAIKTVTVTHRHETNEDTARANRWFKFHIHLLIIVYKQDYYTWMLICIWELTTLTSSIYGFLFLCFLLVVSSLVSCLCITFTVLIAEDDWKGCELCLIENEWTVPRSLHTALLSCFDLE